MATTATNTESTNRIVLEASYLRDLDIWVLEDPFGDLEELEGGEGYVSLMERLAEWAALTGLTIVSWTNDRAGHGTVIVEYV